MIGEIDWWVIRQAAQLAGDGSAVQANISARSVGDPDVLEHIERCVGSAGCAPGLIFEITETAVVEDERRRARSSSGCARLGCGIALDDFGTGYGASPTSSSSRRPPEARQRVRPRRERERGQPARHPGRSSRWRATSSCRRWPRASRSRARWSCCASSASTSPRATTSRTRRRSGAARRLRRAGGGTGAGDGQAGRACGP